MPPVKKLLPS